MQILARSSAIPQLSACLRTESTLMLGVVFGMKIFASEGLGLDFGGLRVQVLLGLGFRGLGGLGGLGL